MDNGHASAWIAHEIGYLAHAMGKGDSDGILQAIGNIRDRLEAIEATQPATAASIYEEMRLEAKARKAAEASSKKMEDA